MPGPARRSGDRTRFTDRPDAATHLADLYQQAATAWTRFTGLEVWQRPCTTKADLDQLAADCLAQLHDSTRPSAT